MTTTLHAISQLPNTPAIYAMYGGGTHRRYVAYVGLGESLRRRIEQHLVKRDSSVSTRTQAVGLNPEHVREVAWWEHPQFAYADALHAAELVAFDVLDPAVRSRGGVREAAQDRYGSVISRRKSKPPWLSSRPTGRLLIPTMPELAERLRNVEATAAELEAHLRSAR